MVFEWYLSPIKVSSPFASLLNNKTHSYFFMYYKISKIFMNLFYLPLSKLFYLKYKASYNLAPTSSPNLSIAFSFFHYMEEFVYSFIMYTNVLNCILNSFLIIMSSSLFAKALPNILLLIIFIINLTTAIFKIWKFRNIYSF